jgi:hypothetical protein
MTRISMKNPVNMESKIDVRRACNEVRRLPLTTTLTKMQVYERKKQVGTGE